MSMIESAKKYKKSENAEQNILRESMIRTYHNFCVTHLSNFYCTYLVYIYIKKFVCTFSLLSLFITHTKYKNIKDNTNTRFCPSCMISCIFSNAHISCITILHLNATDQNVAIVQFVNV